MPLVIPNLTEVKPIGLSPELIQAFAGKRAALNQERFDASNTAMATQLAELGQLDTFDPDAQQEAIERAKQRYGEIAGKYQGDLSAGLSSVKQGVAQSLSDPFYNLNKFKVSEAARLAQMEAVMGKDAIILNDPRKTKLNQVLDKSGNFAKGVAPADAKNLLTAQAMKATDYVALADNLLRDLRADITTGKLQVAKEVQSMLERYQWETLDEPKLLKVINDPGVRQAFLKASTASMDNRSIVGYDPDAKTNMFQRASTDKRFEDGVAEFLYGVGRQKLYNTTTAREAKNDQWAWDMELEAKNAPKGGTGDPNNPNNKILDRNVNADLNAVDQKTIDLLKDVKYDDKGNEIGSSSIGGMGAAGAYNMFNAATANQPIVDAFGNAIIASSPLTSPFTNFAKNLAGEVANRQTGLDAAA